MNRFEKIENKLKSLGLQRSIKFYDSTDSTTIEKETYTIQDKYIVFDYKKDEYYTNIGFFYLLLRPRLLYWIVEKINSVGGDLL